MEKKVTKYENIKSLVLERKLMIMVAILFLTFFFNNDLLAQCKLDKSKDDFTSKVTIQTKGFELVRFAPIVENSFWWYLNMRFIMIEDDLSISLIHSTKGKALYVSSIFFKFKDGTILTFDKYIRGSKRKIDPFWYAFTSFNISKEDLITFSAKDVEKVRINFIDSDDPNYIFPEQNGEINERNGRNAQRDANCLLVEIK